MANPIPFLIFAVVITVLYRIAWWYQSEIVHFEWAESDNPPVERPSNNASIVMPVGISLSNSPDNSSISEHESDDMFEANESAVKLQDELLDAILNGEISTNKPEPLGPADLSGRLHGPPNRRNRRRKYAYVTIVHGVDDTLRYRGYLINAVISRKALREYGSTADFIVLIGFTSSSAQTLMLAAAEQEGYKNETRSPAKIFASDLALLKARGIQVHYLPRIWQPHRNIILTEVSLLKSFVWSLTKYHKLQFLEADVMPVINMDCYFSIEMNAFCSGQGSPLNSVWFIAIPNNSTYKELMHLATKRLLTSWNDTVGWGMTIPDGLLLRGWDRQRVVKSWNFNGASSDQGLFTNYFVLNMGEVALIDESVVRLYEDGNFWSEISCRNFLSVCHGTDPFKAFTHFMGSRKPWLSQNLVTTKSPSLKRWAEHLDSLRLPNITSSSIYELFY